MKGKKKKWLFLASALICFAAFWTVPAQAASDTGVTQLLGTHENAEVSADVTGDGQKDAIKLELTPLDGESVYFDTGEIYVNGKSALIMDIRYSYFVYINYIRMSKSGVFLQIMAGPKINGIYRYDTKKEKLVQVLDVWPPNRLSSGGNVIKVAKNEIQIQCGYAPDETGSIEWVYTYQYKGGKFALKSSIANAKSTMGEINYNKDGYRKYFKKNKFVVANKRTFYTHTNLKKAAFKAKKGDVLKLKKVKISGYNLYLQFQKGNKTGWQKVCRSYVYFPDVASKQWFYGVYRRLTYLPE